IQQLRQLDFHNGRAITSRQKIEQYEQQRSRVKQAFDVAEGIRNDVRRILTAATNTRSMIVKQVFNERLNSLWRDLFVRWAPSEMFVPFFDIPASPARRFVPTIK